MTVAVNTTAPTHRERLVAAMADLVAERDYATVSVTDVVARARVSKRTFYEQFAERDECFLAMYEALATEPLRRIAELLADPQVRALELREQVRRAVGTYLAAIGERPPLTRALLTEIASLGERGRQVRHAVLHRFADQLAGLAGEARGRGAALAPLGPVLALGLVGGINEIILAAVDPAAGPGTLTDAYRAELADQLTELVSAVVLRAG